MLSAELTNWNEQHGLILFWLIPVHLYPFIVIYACVPIFYNSKEGNL